MAVGGLTAMKSGLTLTPALVLGLSFINHYRFLTFQKTAVV